jgi:hypothetical protein
VEVEEGKGSRGLRRSALLFLMRGLICGLSGRSLRMWMLATEKVSCYKINNLVEDEKRAGVRYPERVDRDATCVEMRGYRGHCLDRLVEDE